MTTPVRIAVAVAVHQRRETTLAWLHSLLDGDLTDVELHLALTDDGSTDGTGEAVRASFPAVDIVQGDGALYYAAGTNLAIARAMTHDPDFILVANDDTVLEPDCIQRLLACARAHSRSIVGPVLVRQDDPAHVFQTFPRWQTRFGGWRHRQHLRVDRLPTAPLEVDVVVGNCILVPAAAVAECGLMDDRGVHNWVGDAEWTPRMRRAGWRLLVEPTARVLCQPNDPVPSPWADGLGGVVRTLRDPSSPHGLRWLWTNRTLSGPDPLRGAAAFAIYLARAALRRVGVDRWPDWPDEAVPGPGARPLPEPASEPIEVVLLWPYLSWGGAQIHVIGLAARLSEDARVRALVPDGTDPYLLRLLADHQIGVETFGPPVDLSPASDVSAKVRRRARDARTHLAIWRATRACDPSTTVLHVDLAPWSSVLLLRSLSRRLVVFQTLHTAPPPLSPLRRLMWRAKLELMRASPTYHLTLGNRDAGAGFDALLRRPLGAALTPTAVDIDLVRDALATLDRDHERTGLDVPPGVPLVVGVGQVIARKGIDVLIDALIIDDGPVAVRWIGSGPDRGLLVERARRAGVEHLVRFVDPDALPSRPDLFRAIAAADLYVQPSREEGLPLALVEAMALGVPVVATSVNGIPEVIEDHRTGLLVASDDPVSLAKAMRTVLDDRTLAGQLGRAGAATVTPDHDMATVAATMAQLYRHALDGRGRR